MPIRSEAEQVVEVLWFGYRIAGHARVSHTLDTWGMFQADDG